MCMSSRKHIPKGCKSLTLVYQRTIKHSRNGNSNYPFGDTTIDAGTSLIDRIMEEKKRWAPNDTAYK